MGKKSRLKKQRAAEEAAKKQGLFSKVDPYPLFFALFALLCLVALGALIANTAIFFGTSSKGLESQTVDSSALTPRGPYRYGRPSYYRLTGEETRVTLKYLTNDQIGDIRNTLEIPKKLILDTRNDAILGIHTEKRTLFSADEYAKQKRDRLLSQIVIASFLFLVFGFFTRVLWRVVQKRRLVRAQLLKKKKL